MSWRGAGAAFGARGLGAGVVGALGRSICGSSDTAIRSGCAVGLNEGILMIKNARLWSAIEITKKRLKAVFKDATIVYYRL